MSKPHIAATTPFAIDVEKGKDYYWCALRSQQIAAVLRRQPQGRRVRADQLQRRRKQDCLFLRLQAKQERRALRRHA